MAYIALGRAYLNEDRYDEAVEYFKLAFQDDDYDRAFESRRKEMLRNNFTLIVIIVAALLIVWIVLGILKKKGKIPKKLIATGVGWVVDKAKPAVTGLVAKIKEGGKKK